MAHRVLKKKTAHKWLKGHIIIKEVEADYERMKTKEGNRGRTSKYKLSCLY